MRGVSNNVKGLILAISSSIFIGSSFIIKKKGLQKAGASGIRASDGGFSYLREPMWWAGMLTSKTTPKLNIAIIYTKLLSLVIFVINNVLPIMLSLQVIAGEGANFAAYAFAPAILVTPLGALSIIFSAVLAHFILNERLHVLGVIGCVICLVGSVAIVIHAPLEKDIHSVRQIWHLAIQPGFIIYTFTVVAAVAFLIFWCVPRYGQTHMVVYIGICSLMGSLTVMAVKAVAIALKLSFSGSNQFVYFQPWFFTFFLITFCLLQLVYLNKALDLFNTALVSPVYYVMFTSFTILASTIMFKEWDSQDGSDIVSEVCGFVTILCGVFLLHKTKDAGAASTDSSPSQSETPTADSSPKHSDQIYLWT